jgi:hypothetical protein
MRKLREQAVEVRERLESCSDPEQSRALSSELDDLRGRWRELATRREAAFRRKMIMLGHMDPDEDEVELL